MSNIVNGYIPSEITAQQLFDRTGDCEVIGAVIKDFLCTHEGLSMQVKLENGGELLTIPLDEEAYGVLSLIAMIPLGNMEICPLSWFIEKPIVFCLSENEDGNGLSFHGFAYDTDAE